MCPIPLFITELMQSKLGAHAGACSAGCSGVNEKEEKEEKKKEGGGGERENGAVLTQMTINEYYPGQGISSHIGKEACICM